MEKTKKKIFNILFISVFAAMLGLGIVSPLMPIFAEHLGANGVWLGLIFSGFSLTRGIFMPIVGKISDNRGRKIFIALGLFSYSIISLMYIFAFNVYSLTLVRLIHGLASAMVIPIAMAYVGETAEEGREGSTMGTFSISMFLGMGVGPFLGGILNDTFGLSSVFIAMSGLTMLSFFITLIFLPDVKNFKVKSKTKSFSFKRILKNDIVKGVLIYRMVNAMGRGGVLSFLPIFASKLQISSSQIGLIVSANVITTALLQRPFGKLADRYNKIALILFGATLGSIALLSIPLIKTFSALFLISLVMGLGGAISMPAASAITVIVGQDLGMGTSMGLFNTAMSVGMVMAPLVSGLVMDYLNLSAVFIVAGLISVSGMLIFYYFVRDGMREKNKNKFRGKNAIQRRFN